MRILMSLRSLAVTVALATPAMVALPIAANAQDSGDVSKPAPDSPAASPTSGATGDATQLETVVVTAQRRSEANQDVPITVNVIDAKALAEQEVVDPSSLTSVVPGLNVQKLGNGASIFLRGIGTNLYGPNVEQTVSLYVDGVYNAASSASFFSFNNIERVEVLKGPQGTLFGRNTTGGVVQIITKDPSHDPSADFELGYANYGTVTGSAYATDGITDTLAVDFAGIYANQDQGWGRNITTGGKTGLQADNNFGLRTKFLWTPASGTRVVLALDYFRGFNSDTTHLDRKSVV
jgi:iron complex outermembrane receptor protein